MSYQRLLYNRLSSFIQSIEVQTSHKRSARLNIGVCVSGGPDSMGLAYLLRQLQLSGITRFQLSAWIVDHKARSNSTDEAKQVQNNLTTIGLSSSILTMAWPENINPLQLSDFESQARSKRYELLTAAAVENKIRHLFLGHHQDDQVETILMRLIRNQNTTLKGLTGMASTLSLPITFDVPQISMEPFDIPKSCRVPRLPAVSNPQTLKRKSSTINSVRIIKPFNVLLQRPFLGFPKIALVETCEQNNVPYVTDYTNKDPKTSLRNAIRYMRSNYALPRALDKSRIMKLQTIAQHHVESIKVDGEAILERCKVMAFDIRSGVAKIHIPFTLPHVLDAIDTHSYAVSWLKEMVTPSTSTSRGVRIPPPTLLRFVVTSTEGNTTDQSILPFTLDKVQFTPCQDEPQTWILSRQPMHSAEITANTKHFSWNNKKNVCSSDELLERRSTSNFSLWDNRFWIQISVDSATAVRHDPGLGELQLRPLTKMDMVAVKDELLKIPRWRGKNRPGSARAELLQILHDAAPGNIRYTLPVLTFKDRVVAFPTLSYRLDRVLEESGLSSLTFRVYYKSFGLSNLLLGPNRLNDIVKMSSDDQVPKQPSAK